MKTARHITTSLVLVLILSATTSAFAKGGGFSGGGSRSFSSPSRSFSAPSAPSRSYSAPSAPSAPRPASPPPSAPSYVSPPSSAPKYVAPAPSAPRPSAPNFDSSARAATAHAESQKRWEASLPKTSPSQPAVGIGNEGSAQAKTYTPVAPNYTREQYNSREKRAQVVFGQPSQQSSYSSQPQVVHNDVFGNTFFWLWLMDHNRPQGERDKWVYNHKDEMDPARFEELKKNDADLETRLKTLEARGEKKDPHYVPPELKGNEDLMYKDDVVKQHVTSESSLGTFLWVMLFASLFCFALWFLFWPRIERSRS